MKENLWTVLVTSVILQCFGEVDAHSVHLDPSPVAKVEEGNTLILQCIYNGSNTPDFINWYLNNDTFGLVIEASSCEYITTPQQYDIDRYNISCHETKFNLSIASISKDKDDQDTWECDTTVFPMLRPQKASTTIVVIDAGENGQSDEPKTVADTGMVVGVISAFTVVIAVVIAVVGYFLHRKRRNDHLKNEIKKDHDEDHVKDHEQMGKFLEVDHLKNKINKDHHEDYDEDYDDNHEQMGTRLEIR